MIAFIFVISIFFNYSSYPKKFKQIENEVKKLERLQKGEDEMSQLLAELVGKSCKLYSDEGLTIVSNHEIPCTVLAVDEEWIKFSTVDKKNIEKIAMIRIESLEKVVLNA